MTPQRDTSRGVLEEDKEEEEGGRVSDYCSIGSLQVLPRGVDTEVS